MMTLEPETEGSEDARVLPDRPSHCGKREVLIPALLTLTFRYLLKLIPLGTLIRLIGLSVKPTVIPNSSAHPFVCRMRDRIDFIGIHYPMLGDCIPQCLAAGILLRLHGIASTLQFGVIKSHFAGDPLQAHAWLSSEGIVVAGRGSSAAYQQLKQSAANSN